MTKKTLFALLALICAISLFTGCSTSDPEGEAEASHIRYRYASAEEGRQIRLSNTAYYNSLTQNDIDWKLRCTGKTIDDFKIFSASQIQDFTDDEKKALDAMINSVEIRMRGLGIGLSLCQSIIRAHGGEISVTDNAPHGAAFEFTLPRDEVSMRD